MRAYGRVPVDPLDPKGPKRWVKVETDSSGDNTQVIITWLAQVLLLNIDESPFFGSWGIPSRQSVLQQVAPDIFVTLVQERFSPYFAALTVSKQNVPTPTYVINAVTLVGVRLPPINIPVPI